MEAQPLEAGHKSGEGSPAGTIGMVVMICPTESQLLLTIPLHARRMVATHPVFPFRLEEEIACPSGT